MSPPHLECGTQAEQKHCVLSPPLRQSVRTRFFAQCRFCCRSLRRPTALLCSWTERLHVARWKQSMTHFSILCGVGCGLIGPFGKTIMPKSKSESSSSSSSQQQCNWLLVVVVVVVLEEGNCCHWALCCFPLTRIVLVYCYVMRTNKKMQFNLLQ